MSYDPSGSDATAYTARIAITDTYGAKEYDEPLSTPANQPHHVRPPPKTPMQHAGIVKSECTDARGMDEWRSTSGAWTRVTGPWCWTPGCLACWTSPTTTTWGLIALRCGLLSCGMPLRIVTALKASPYSPPASQLSPPKPTTVSTSVRRLCDLRRCRGGVSQSTARESSPTRSRVGWSASYLEPRHPDHGGTALGRCPSCRRL
jgi:hypothetical protein